MSDSFKVSGKRVALESAASGWKLTQRPGGWVIAEHSSGRRVRLMAHQIRNLLGANIGGRLWHGELSEKQYGAAGSGQSAADSDLVAQFPGKVRKVLISQDVQVQEGEPLILVEAMKMEFAIKAPFEGKVTRVLVKEGQQLSPGDRFLDLEAKASG